MISGSLAKVVDPAERLLRKQPARSPQDRAADHHLREGAVVRVRLERDDHLEAVLGKLEREPPLLLRLGDEEPLAAPGLAEQRRQSCPR